MAFKEFTGQLDAPQPSGNPGTFKEFTGEIDTSPDVMTDREAWESSMPVRALRGLEGPAITLLKMVGPDSIKGQLAEIDKLRESGMKKRGNEGFDWAGLVGSLVPGGAIAKGVTGALPAAASLVGKMGIGATVGAATSAAQPLPNGQDELSLDKLKQAGAGAVVGGAIPAVTQGVKSFFGTNQLNPTQLATLKEGHAAGYTVPPTSINPSGLNTMVESIAGKASVGQEAAARNQHVTSAISPEDIGLAKGTTLSEAVIDKVRKKAGESYEAVSKLRPPKDMPWFPRYHDTDLVDQLKQAHLSEKDAWKQFGMTGDSKLRDKAVQAGQLADSIHDDLVSIAKANGKEDLVSAMDAAKVRIAKAHDLEKALTIGDSNISAPVLKSQLDKAGSKAKSGNMLTIAKMADAFPNVMREGSKVPKSGVDGTNAMMSPILAAMGYGAAGPAGTVAAALPWVARPAARNLALSTGYQNTLAQGIPPRYQALIDAMTQQASGAAGTAVGRNQ